MHPSNVGILLFREYQLAFDQCFSFAQLAEPGAIGFCIGAGGAGKTSLARALGPALYGREETWLPQTMPYVYVEADIADRGYFSPKWFIRHCLLALYDPFRARPEDIANWPLPVEMKRRLISITSMIVGRTHGEPEMRAAFINLARLLKVQLLIVDEANLLLLTQLNRIPTDYLEGLRRLGDQIGCPVLLFGTIKLLDLLGYSAQLNRRTFRVHLDRMSCGDAAGVKDFIGFLNGIETGNGLKSGLLSERANEVHQWTHGIPGEVVGLVGRAKILAAAEGLDVAWSHIEGACHLPDELSQMKAEADWIQSVMEGRPMKASAEPTSAPRKPRRMNARRTRNKGYVP